MILVACGIAVQEVPSTGIGYVYTLRQQGHTWCMALHDEDFWLTKSFKGASNSIPKAAGVLLPVLAIVPHPLQFCLLAVQQALQLHHLHRHASQCSVPALAAHHSITLWAFPKCVHTRDKTLLSLPGFLTGSPAASPWLPCSQCSIPALAAHHSITVCWTVLFSGIYICKTRHCSACLLFSCFSSYITVTAMPDSAALVSLLRSTQLLLD